MLFLKHFIDIIDALLMFLAFTRKVILKLAFFQKLSN